MTASAPPDDATTAERPPLLLILDSHGIIYRSYFALREALTLRKTGEPVGAVYGFANSLLYALGDSAPRRTSWPRGTAPRPPSATRRTQTTRPRAVPMPDDLRPQVGRVRALLDAFHIPVVEVPGFEADDVVGSLATQAAAAGRRGRHPHAR